MITDIGTVAWKEWSELILLRGARRTGLFNLALNLGVFGVFLPWQMGRTWTDSISTVFWFLFVATFWTTGYIADSFAGERERHTLETLLASRLSNRAILFGKYGAVLAFIWGQMLIALALGAVTVTLTQGHGQMIFYRASVLWGAAGFGLLGSGLVAGLGILISLRAPTVRQAQQVLLIPLTILLMLPSVGVMILPSGLQARVYQWLAEADVTRLVLAGSGLLLVIDLGLLAAALARFQRARLILD